MVDRLAAEGINYRRAYNQNTVCMPARSTMLTGQYVRTHGVVANGIALPTDAPSIAQYLHDKAGYRTALLGKAHFEPASTPSCDSKRTPGGAGRQRSLAWLRHDPSRPCMPAAFRGHPIAHYGRWLKRTTPNTSRASPASSAVCREATQVRPRRRTIQSPREWYHTDWVADLTVDWLASLGADDPGSAGCRFRIRTTRGTRPASELPRVPWQDLDLPPGHPGSDEEIRKVLARKPAHWLALLGRHVPEHGGWAGHFVPSKLSDDQIREVSAKVHVMNELIDEACGRVLRTIEDAGLARGHRRRVHHRPRRAPR